MTSGHTVRLPAVGASSDIPIVDPEQTHNHTESIARVSPCFVTASYFELLMQLQFRPGFCYSRVRYRSFIAVVLFCVTNGFLFTSAASHDLTCSNLLHVFLQTWVGVWCTLQNELNVFHESGQPIA